MKKNYVLFFALSVLMIALLFLTSLTRAQTVPTARKIITASHAHRLQKRKQDSTSVVVEPLEGFDEQGHPHMDTVFSKPVNNTLVRQAVDGNKIIGMVPAQIADAAVVPLISKPHAVIHCVITTDGYQLPMLPKAVADAQGIADYFMVQPWLAPYADAFDWTMLSIPSVDSGALHPNNATDCNTASPLVPVRTGINTYFGATFDYGGTHRLLYCPRTSAISDAIAFYTPNCTKSLILVNTPYYGGSGGTYAIGSTNVSSKTIMLHEFGHSFAGLADEYGGSYCGAAPKPNVWNGIGKCPWHAWLNPTETTFPTPPFTGCGDGFAHIYCGAFVGANYCGTCPDTVNHVAGWCKPFCDCLMGNLTKPLCSVCKETYVKVIWQYIGSNIFTAHTLAAVTYPNPLPAPAVWYPSITTLKRYYKSNGRLITSSADLPNGTSTVTVYVTDTTTMNRTYKLPVDSIVFNYTKSVVTAVAPTITASNTTASACNATNGAISTTATGTAPLSFVWSNGATTQNLSGLAAGTYSVTVTNTAGTARASYTVAQQPCPPTITNAVIIPASCNTADGAVTITTAGTQPIAYRWSNGTTRQNLTGVTTGAYTVTITNAAGTTSAGYNVPMQACPTGCVVPTFTVSNITQTTARIVFTPENTTYCERVRVYTADGTVGSWYSVNYFSGAKGYLDIHTLNATATLQPNTVYEVEVRKLCNGSYTVWSAAKPFTTKP